MISKSELELFDSGYRLDKNIIINSKVEVREYKKGKDKVISIYNDNTKSSILLKDLTFKKILNKYKK